MLKFVSVSLLSLVFLSACGGRGSSGSTDPNVNADGTCTTAFKTDYNSVVNAQDIKDLKNNCDAFRAQHAKTVTCRGPNAGAGSGGTGLGGTGLGGTGLGGTGQDKQFQAADIYASCAKADASTNGKTLGMANDGLQGVNSCTTQFQTDYNDFNQAVNDFYNSTSSDYSGLKKKCDAFRGSNTETVDCEGSVTKKGNTRQIHMQGSDVYSICTKVDGLVRVSSSKNTSKM